MASLRFAVCTDIDPIGIQVPHLTIAVSYANDDTFAVELESTIGCISILEISGIVPSAVFISDLTTP